MCLDNANGIQVVERAENLRTQLPKPFLSYMRRDVDVSVSDRMLPQGALGVPWGFLGAPGSPWEVLGGSEASLGVTVSGTDRCVMYTMEIIYVFVMSSRLQLSLINYQVGGQGPPNRCCKQF